MKKFLIIFILIALTLVFFIAVPFIPVKGIECVDYISGGECKERKIKTSLLFLIVNRKALKLDISGN